MDILIFVGYIALLGFAVTKFAGDNRQRWIYTGYTTAFLLPILVFFLTTRIVGTITGDGIAGGAAGLGYAFATLITGFIFLYIGYVSKNVQER